MKRSVCRIMVKRLGVTISTRVRKEETMKKAFTMLELVFVIVVVGILSFVVASRFERNTLREAADQLVGHIRYTQHLAMMNDKYVPNPGMSNEAGSAAKTLEAQEWYKGRWHIFFSPTANGTISYSIMSDSTKSNYDGNPNANFTSAYSEVAQDPLNSQLYLIGTTYSSFDGGSSRYINEKLDLKATYGIQDISITGGSTGSTATRIIFDNLGRPYRSTVSSLTNHAHRLAFSAITVKLCLQTCTTPANTPNNLQEIVVSIEPETGYAYVLQN